MFQILNRWISVTAAIYRGFIHVSQSWEKVCCCMDVAKEFLWGAIAKQVEYNLVSCLSQESRCQRLVHLNTLPWIVARVHYSGIWIITTVCCIREQHIYFGFVVPCTLARVPLKQTGCYIECCNAGALHARSL